MSLFTDAEGREIASTYVVANTSASFYRWLTRSRSVLRIAEHASEDAMMDELATWIAKPTKTELALGCAYAALIAIGLKRRALNSQIGAIPIEAGSLDWASEFWSRLNHETVGVSTIRLTANLAPKLNVPAVNTSQTAFTLLNMHGNPIA